MAPTTRVPGAAALLSAAFAAACSPSSPTEPASRVESVRSAVLAGRRSGEDENANVAVETTQDTGAPLHCSGRLVTPRLVLTARHCLRKTRIANLTCTADGSPTDLGADQSLEPAARITVQMGSDRAALRPLAVEDVLTTLEVSACKSDIAFLVLRDEALPVRTPFRRAPVVIGTELTISGWGATADGEKGLPMHRSTREGVRIVDVGPGFVPAGTFVVGGNSLCFGDSGAVALVGGAVVGVYSRIVGESCAALDSQNLLSATATESALVARAFAAIGEAPWYDDSPPPWLAADGAPCGGDADCQSSVCEETRCKRACGAGPACPSGLVCVEATRCAAAVPEPPPAQAPGTNGCSSAPAPRAPGSGRWLGVALAVVVLASRSSRLRRTE